MRVGTTRRCSPQRHDMTWLPTIYSIVNMCVHIKKSFHAFKILLSRTQHAIQTVQFVCRHSMQLNSATSQCSCFLGSFPFICGFYQPIEWFLFDSTPVFFVQKCTPIKARGVHFTLSPGNAPFIGYKFPSSVFEHSNVRFFAGSSNQQHFHAASQLTLALRPLP